MKLNPEQADALRDAMVAVRRSIAALRAVAASVDPDGRLYGRTLTEAAHASTILAARIAELEMLTDGANDGATAGREPSTAPTQACGVEFGGGLGSPAVCAACLDS